MNMKKVEQVVAAIGTGGPLDTDRWRSIAFRYARKTKDNRKVSDAYRTRARAAALKLWENAAAQRDAAYKI